MDTLVALLRGINLGPRNRIAMPALREALTGAGHARVRTYVQSGNIVLDSELDESGLADALAGLIAERFELDVPVVVRSAAALAQVVADNPFPEAARLAPKRYQVTFFSAPLADDVAARVRARSSEQFLPDTEAISLAISNQNAYGWHPDGIHVSKLARELGDRKLGVVGTARNWATVTALLAMATADAA